jgi:hypothetical protein
MNVRPQPMCWDPRYVTGAPETPASDPVRRAAVVLFERNGRAAPVAAVPGHGQRGQHVHVFAIRGNVGAQHWVAREVEPGCPVSWFTRADFLASCPFRAFYERMFDVLAERSR